MNKTIKKRLLREALDIILIAAIAAVLALVIDYIIDTKVRQVVVDDYQRNEWVKAARQANVPSSVIEGGDADSITSKY